MQFVFAPLLGRLSDGRGRRPVLMLSLAGSVVAWTVFGLAGEVLAVSGVVAGVATLFASRMLAGAMGGNIATAQAYVADVTPVDRRAASLGLIGAAFSLGFIFGPALGGILANDGVVAAARDLLPPLVPTTRFSLPSFGAATLSLLALVSTALFLPEPERTRTAARRTTLVGSFVEALADVRLRGLVVSFFLLSLAFSGVQVMFIPFAADVYGYDATQTAFFLTYIGFLGAVNQGVLVGRLSARYESARLAVVGASVLLVSLVLLPFSPDVGRLLPTLGGPVWFTRELFVLLVDGALLSFGNSLLNVSLSTLVSTRASADRQGSAFGVTQGAGSLGRTIGPPAMAALYVVGFPLPFVVGAVILVPIIYILAGAARKAAPSVSL
jgi:MFS family permease